MNSFKIGDRVAVYNLSRRVGVVENDSCTSIDSEKNKFPMLGVKTSHGTVYAHPKQCRRLKAKPKPRSVFVSLKNLSKVYENEGQGSAGNVATVPIWDSRVFTDQVEFREVLK